VEKSAEAVVVKMPVERREERRAEEQTREQPRPDCGQVARSHPKREGSGNIGSFPTRRTWSKRVDPDKAKRERKASHWTRERRRKEDAQ